MVPLLVALGVASLLGCSDGDGAALVVADGVTAYPSAQPSDWVSYADAVVLLSVQSEEAVPPPDDVASGRRPEFAQDRVLQVAREDVVWSHRAATAVPPTFPLRTAGWWVKEGGATRTPMVVGGPPRLEVSRTYVAAVVVSPDGQVDALGGSQMLVEDGRLKVDEADGPLAEMDGWTIDQLRERLATTQADPVAEANRHLAPAARYRAVVDGARSPGDGS